MVVVSTRAGVGLGTNSRGPILCVRSKGAMVLRTRRLFFVSGAGHPFSVVSIGGLAFQTFCNGWAVR